MRTAAEFKTTHAVMRCSEQRELPPDPQPPSMIDGWELSAASAVKVTENHIAFFWFWTRYEPDPL